MKKFDKGGNLVWVLNKANEIYEAYQIYEATQSESALIDVATKTAELIGIGIPLYYLDKALTKTGLDRVFDSLRRNQTYEAYLRRQGLEKLGRDVGLGVLAEWGIHEFREWLSYNGYLDPLFETIDDLFRGGQRFVVRRDPLTLDLDGDGLETIAVSAGVLFDHNADGIATGTGWVARDDGFLVWDRDGDGLITSGRELFGDSTLKSNGQLAADGFDALGDLDSNADGKVDDLDARFSQLLVWRDLDQDGISESGELLTLASLGIAGFNVAKTANNQLLTDGNRIADLGSYIKTDGSVATMGDVGRMGDIDLAEDTFHRRFLDEIPLTEQAKLLPSMQASGLVRDMQQAASLQTSAGNNFAAALAAYSALPTRSAQLAMLDELLSKWASTSGVPGMVEAANNVQGADYAFIINGEQPFHTGWGIDTQGRSGGTLFQDYGIQVGLDYEKVAEPDLWSYSPTARAWLEKIGVLEAFYGSMFTPVAPEGDHGGTQFRAVDVNDPNMGARLEGIPLYLIQLNGGQLDLLGRAYDALRQSVYEQLAMQTRLKPYIDTVLVGSPGNVSVDLSGLTSRYAAAKQSSPVDAMTDLVELVRYAGSELHSLGWDAAGFLRSEIEANQADPAVQALMSALGVRFVSGSASGTAAHEVLLGAAAADAISGGDGIDVIVSQDGNDSLWGDAGNDILDGGAGNDYLRGGAGDDTYLFGIGSGQDRIENYDWWNGRPEAGWESAIDVLQFKPGIAASDVTARRQGGSLVLTLPATGDQVRIDGHFWNDLTSIGFGIDQIWFADGTVWTDEEIRSLVTAGTPGNDTLIGFADSGDTIDGGSGNDNVQGRGGNDSLLGGDGDDSLSGDAGSDTLEGGAGNDNLSGGTENDTLLGGDGNDSLSGDAGADLLEGGAGNDWLRGHGGSDVYLFGRGDGQDTVDFDSWNGLPDAESSTTTDVVRFKDGVLPSEVVVRRVGQDLVLSIGGTTDSIRIAQEFRNDASVSEFGVDEVQFADGTVWNRSMFPQMVLTGTAAGETLIGFSDRDDTIDGLEGNDNIQGRAGNDLLVGGAGDDTLNGEAGNDTLQGGAGNDSLTGDVGADVLEGGAGNDWARGFGGGDTYLFGRGDGQDTAENYDAWNGVPDAEASTTTDVIRFKDGVLPSEVLARRSGGDLVLSIIGTTDSIRSVQQFRSDLSVSEYGVDQVQFADGTVWTRSMLAQMVLASTAAGETLTGFSDLNDTIDGGGGNDTVQGRSGTDSLLGGDGDDSVSGDAGSDALEGGAGNDWLSGGSENDTLLGGLGNDTLNGDAGADLLEGGAGNDWMRGHGGSDVYLFGRGDGQDTVENYDSWNGLPEPEAASTADVIRFKPGVLASEVVAQRSSNDLVLTIAGTTDSIRVSQQFRGDSVAHEYGIDQVEFAEGTVWNRETLRGLVLGATAGNNTLIGFSDGDTIDGGGGNDTIYGRTGDDLLIGGAGDDSLNGEAGNDTLQGGLGNDSLTGDVGADLLDGGAGNDWMRGYGGSDTYLFGRGDGQDTAENYDAWNGLPDAEASTTSDVIRFKDGVLPSEVLARRSGGDLVLSIIGTTDSIRSVQQFRSDLSVSEYGVDQVQFADGTVWTRSMLAQMVLASTAAGETLTGFSDLNDTIDGGAGNDTVQGRSGNDSLLGGDGDDSVSGDAGSDALEGGAGNDWLSGGSENDTLLGGLGNDTLNGDAGADLLEGGAGNDWMRGHGGSDVYLFGRGDGQDTVENYDSWNGLPDIEASTTTDVIRFKDGVLPSEVLARRNGSDLVLSIVGTTDSIRSVQQFRGDSVNHEYGVDQIQFADGTVWTRTMLRDMVLAGTAAGETLIGFSDRDDTIDGLEGNDNIQGRAGNDLLVGGAGDDTLNGEAGNDTLQGGLGNDSLTGDVGADLLDGGAGNDWMRGYGGSDTYLFGRGDGQDTAENYDAWNGVPDAEASTTSDVIRFKDGVLPSEVLARRSGGDLVLSIIGTTDSIRSVQQFRSDLSVSEYGVDQVQFADGTVWTRSMLAQMVLASTAAGETLTGFSDLNDTIDGGAGNDTVQGRSGNDSLLGGDGDDSVSGDAGSDTLEGGAGNDWLSGGSENDTLLGGLGNDTLNGDAGADLLEGGAGNDWMRGHGGSDVYLFGRGDGQDTVENYDSWNGLPDIEASTTTDVIRFKDGVLPSEVLARRNGSDLVLSIVGTTDSIRSVQQFRGDSVNHEYGVDQIQFADGTVWTRTMLRDMVLAGTAAGETLIGFSDRDDTIDGLEGNDNIQGRAGNDLLVGGAGDDTLNGEAGNDTLQGGLGNDSLTGDVGADLLDGGAGNDWMRGYGGSDTYLFGRGDGQDTAENYDAWNGLPDAEASTTSDVIRFKDGVLPSEVLARRSGGDLVLSIIGTTDSIRSVQQFRSDLSVSEFGVDQIQFADGTVWSRATIADKALEGTAQGETLDAFNDRDDVVLAQAGNDTVNAKGGNDYVHGGDGADTINGDAGTDLLQGGLGADTIGDSAGNGLMDGGGDNDSLTGSGANQLFIGGGGNDSLNTGAGADIVAFNRGEGADTVAVSTVKDNSLSLGGGIAYADLFFQKSGTNLVLKTAGTAGAEQIAFTNWYSASANRSVLNLQVVVEASADFDAASSDPLRNKKVAQFNFDALVAQFDAALAANPGLTSWALTNALTSFHLGGSDTAALGGDLAYRYGLQGNLAAVGSTGAQNVLASAQFGTAAQTFQAQSALEAGLIRLT